MSRARPKQPVRTKATAKPRRPSLKKQLAVVFGIALLGATVTAAVLTFEHLFGPPPEPPIRWPCAWGTGCLETPRVPPRSR